MQTRQAFLEVKSLTKDYGAFRLEDISFSLQAGYILGYVGPNGAGKTTTLSLLTHLRRADAGQVSLEGIRYEQDPVRFRDRIGYIGDSAYFPERLDRGRIAGILRDFYPSFDRAAFDAMCERWELPRRGTISTYSRGMRVRLMFAAALSRETSLLVLDEATNGLDPVMRREILELLKEYIDDGKRSVIFSTHIMEDLQDMADYIFLLNKGRKVLYETKEELLERYILVKGGPADLNGPLRDVLIGLSERDFGFEALYDTRSGKNLPAGLMTLQPSVDQVVVHLLAGGEKACTR